MRRTARKTTTKNQLLRFAGIKAAQHTKAVPFFVKVMESYLIIMISFF